MLPPYLLHQDPEFVGLYDCSLSVHLLVWWEGGWNCREIQMRPQRRQLVLQDISLDRPLLRREGGLNQRASQLGCLEEAQAVQRPQMPQLELQDISLQHQSLLPCRLPLALPAVLDQLCLQHLLVWLEHEERLLQDPSVCLGLQLQVCRESWGQPLASQVLALPES